MIIKARILSIFLIALLFFSGCTSQLEIGIRLDSKWKDIPMTDDFKFVAPTKSSELMPGLMLQVNKVEALESIPVLDENNPYLEMYGEKGRFLILNVTAWKTKEIKKELPLMISINVLGWADEILNDEHIIETIENSFGLQLLDPELVTSEKQDFLLCFPTEGASYGWIIHVYKEINGELFLEKRFDTGI